jgi:GDSL-like Lipase/Acylhydrolase family
MPDIIPPGTAAPGTGNPPTDMNDVAGVLSLLCGYPEGSTITQGQVPLPPQANQAQALTPFRTALANRQFARCDVACLGDSITEGQHATAIAFRWVNEAATEIRTRYPTPSALGTGGGRGFIGCTQTGESSFPWPTTKAGSPTIVNQGPKAGDGSSAAAFQLNATGQSFTFALNGDSADIMWVQVGFGGTFSYQVDSGSTTNQSTNGGSTQDGKITHVSLGSAGSHTLKLAWVSGNATVDGVIEYNGDYTSGIQFHDCGHYGWTTTSWVTALASGTVAGPAAAIAALTPNAIIITLGVNDQFANTSPATFQTNLQTIITDLKAQLSAPYPSFILQMLPPREGQSGYTYPWPQYVQAAWNVAAADTSGPNNVSIVSVLDWTQGPLAPGADQDVYGIWQSGDNVHPSNLGHQLIADRIISWLA